MRARPGHSAVEQNRLLVEMPRITIIKVMRGSKNHGPEHGRSAIGDDTVRAVQDRSAKHQQHHACASQDDDYFAAVAAKSEEKSDDADRHNDEQHLNVEMSLAELTERRQHGDQDRQRQAMQQTESGQSDGDTVQPSRRFWRIVIHHDLPLCSVVEICPGSAARRAGRGALEVDMV